MQEASPGEGPERAAVAGRSGFSIVVLAVLAVAGCAAPPQAPSGAARVWDPKLGVWSSPRLVADGEAVPRGGGSYLTGRPYTIGGRTYIPNQNASGYSAVGTASWYGDAFHGRRTANGEIFDKGSISAAHPTLPLPSYVRVSNLKNGRSIVVRVNDRGPYHGGRVMDVSQRVAEALEFRGEGTARVKVDFIGRAALQGSDDARLMASLRTDGAPAQIDGMPADAPVQVARGDDEARPGPAAQPSGIDDRAAPIMVQDRSRPVPLPPQRPFTLGTADRGSMQTDGLAALVARSTVVPLHFAPDEAVSQAGAAAFRRIRRDDTLPLRAVAAPEP